MKSRLFIMFIFFSQFCLSQNDSSSNKTNELKIQFEYNVDFLENFIVKATFDSIVIVDLCPFQQNKYKCSLFKIKIDTIYFMQCSESYKQSDLFHVQYILVPDSNLKLINKKKSINVSLKLSEEPYSYLILNNIISVNLDNINKFNKASSYLTNVSVQGHDMTYWERFLWFTHIKRKNLKSKDDRKIISCFADYISKQNNKVK